MLKLGSVKNPTMPGVTNACVPQAISAVTGLDPDQLIRDFRLFEPKACTRREGTGRGAYVPVLRQRGFAVHLKEWDKPHPEFEGYTKRDRHVPMHKALADLAREFPGRCFLIVVNERRKSSHMIAGQGFLLVDNTSHEPMWYGDWIARWQSSRSYGGRQYRYDTYQSRYVIRKPRPTTVYCAYVLEKSTQVAG